MNEIKAVKKKYTRKRPAFSVSLKESNKLLIDTLAIQTSQTRSSILDSFIDYIVKELGSNPDKVLDLIQNNCTKSS